ncbi:MAG: hypothetical protein ACK5NY_03580 [Burkholderiaceae bacterium]
MTTKGTYEAVFGHMGMTPDEIGNRMIALQDALAALLAHEGEREYSGIGTEHDSAALQAAKKTAYALLEG